MTTVETLALLSLRRGVHAEQRQAPNNEKDNLKPYNVQKMTRHAKDSWNPKIKPQKLKIFKPETGKRQSRKAPRTLRAPNQTLNPKALRQIPKI